MAREFGYRFLEHTADAMVECRARDLPHLLELAAQSLYAIALTRVRTETGQSRHVSLEAAGRNELLIRWLQELLYLLETERFAGVRFNWETADAAQLDAHITGYICAPDERETEVKAATYHHLSVEEKEGVLVARFVLDL